MVAENSAHQLARWARLASQVMGLGAIAVLVLASWVAVMAVFNPELVISLFLQGLPSQLAAVSGAAGPWLFIASLPQFAALMWGAYAAWVAFALIADRKSISYESALWIRRAGIGFAVTALAMLVAHPLNSAIASLWADQGKKFISVSIGTPELMTLLVSLVLLVLAQVIKLAAEIEHDNKLFV